MEPLADLARAVLDGSPVDWAAAESGAEPAARPVIRQLRLLEGLAAVHRRESRDAPTRSWTPAVFSMPALVAAPERWGHLEILERIGRGAFGAVYRAWDSRLDREVALKLLPARPPRDGAGSSSIIEEGRLLARVRHANVVTIHGAEQIGDQVGLWMELVRGQTLEQLLQRGTTFSAAEVIAIGAELAGAIAAVHGAGLLHRDIKAHNVTRARDGRVVLMDFGAGRELGDGSSSDLTGTPLYLAPEVFRGESATVQSDIYGLGVLLYHLLTGAYPVQGRTLSELRRAHERADRVPLCRARRDLPSGLVRVIDRAIDPDPSARYRTADALASDLTALGRGRGGLTSRRAAAAAVLVAVMAGAGWWAFGSRGDGPRLAVLEFQSLGASPDDAIFTRGLSHEIQRKLAGLQGLTLLSFSASSEFPAAGRDIRAAARRLDADLVLDGDVLRSGRTLRVTARLVRIGDGVTIWNDTFDRPDTEIFRIQDEIARALGRSLRVALRLHPRPYEPAVDVYYQQFLPARALQSRRDPASLLAAAELFEQVVARDRNYAAAWAGIATSLANTTRLRPDEALLPRIEEAARKAIEIDETLPDTQLAMAMLISQQMQWPAANAAFRRAIDRDPSVAFGSTEYVLSVLLPQQRYEDALDQLKTAASRDPLSLDVRRVMALVQVDSGRYAEAIESSRWVLERQADFPFAATWLARALVLSGRPEESLAVIAQHQLSAGYRGYVYAVLNRRAEAEAIAAAPNEPPRTALMIYSALGDRDRALAALEQEAATNPWRAATWMTRPEMALLRGEPRYLALRDRFGLPR